jgi:ABC-type transport system involved in multi-copper enzyme maturation permease subunit
VALTSLQETLRRKVLWIVLVLLVIIGMIVSSSTVILKMATESGEAGVSDSIRSSLISQTLGLWTSAGVFLAVFLGAVGLSSEVAARTIVTVLSRPIDRWAYLTGRWFGVVSFLWAFQLLGILLALGLARALHADFSPTLWLGLLGSLVNVLLLSGVSLGLSVVTPPVLAGVLAFLVPVIPQLVAGLTRNPRWVFRLPALAAYYLTPAAMPVNLIADSFSKQLLHPDYGLYGRVLGENAVYVVMVFALSCLVFARKELRLR